MGNRSFRQRLVRQHMKSIRQRQMSVRQRLWTLYVMWYNSFYWSAFVRNVLLLLEKFIAQQTYPNYNRHMTFGIKQPHKDKPSKAGFLFYYT